MDKKRKQAIARGSIPPALAAGRKSTLSVNGDCWWNNPA